MITLYFTHGFGNLSEAKVIGTYETILQCREAIAQNLKEYDTESYYQRICDTDNGIVIDYGSHFHFFLIQGVSFKDFTTKQEHPTTKDITFQVTIHFKDVETFQATYPNFSSNYQSLEHWCREGIQVSCSFNDLTTIKIDTI